MNIFERMLGRKDEDQPSDTQAPQEQASQEEAPEQSPEQSVEEKKVVDTTYDNMGDYYMFYPKRKDGSLGEGVRANSDPSDGESMKAEYRKFREDLGLVEESELNI